MIALLPEERSNYHPKGPRTTLHDLLKLSKVWQLFFSSWPSVSFLHRLPIVFSCHLQIAFRLSVDVASLLFSLPNSSFLTVAVSRLAPRSFFEILLSKVSFS